MLAATMNSLLQFDKDLFLFLNFDGGSMLDTLFWHITDKETWIPLYCVILWFIYRRYGWRYMLASAAAIALCVLATDQICNFFKDNTPKLRPSHNPTLDGLVHTVRNYKGGFYGTISAHAATTFSVACFTSWIFRSRWYTWAIFGWCLLVCYSRIYVGVHFPFDIMFGLITGGLVSWLAIYGFKRIPPYLLYDTQKEDHI